MATRRVPKTAEPVQPRVYGYARVSTQEQAQSGISLDEQQRRIAAKCLGEGWVLTEMFVERGISGSTSFGKRPEGGRLLRLVRPGDHVIASKLDRAFRSALDALQVIEDFRRRGIHLWCLDLGDDCSGNGISGMVVTIMSAVAQFERERISERARDTKLNLCRNGRHQGGSRPFGWQPGEVNGTGKARDLVEIPAEQRAIATMNRMRARGASLMAIRDAIRAKGFEISHEAVRGILARGAEGEAA